MKRNIVKTSGKVEQKRGMEQIVIPVTKAQLELITERCDQFRVSPSEAAKCALFAHLYQDDENQLEALRQATEEKRTGKNPGWESCKDELKKLVA